MRTSVSVTLGGVPSGRASQCDIFMFRINFQTLSVVLIINFQTLSVVLIMNKNILVMRGHSVASLVSKELLN